jgi:2-octaprenyl-3-methyl-6-methoxy-1,4-benzoquinol hydroxylase
MDQAKFDCCIVGGGMIGAALALGLAKQSYKVALIEQNALAAYEPSQKPDIRVSALNMHSVNLLTKLGAWQFVLNMRCRSYNTLSVSDGESLGVMKNTFKKLSTTRFSASEINQPLLGYFVENRLLQLAIYEEIKASHINNVSCIHEQSVANIDAQNAVVTLANNTVVSARLIIGADGANSQVRKAAGIASTGWRYTQKANAVLIHTKDKVDDETYQTFYASGPRALLPMYGNYACLVWYDNAEKSAWIQSAPYDDLKIAIEEHFPKLNGEFDIVEVAGFPLTRMHARSYGKGKTLIAGDAAHTINPLAGQGVNLGFKDVAAILDIVAKDGLQDLASIIRQYEQKRKTANLLMMSTMDVIYKTFSSSFMPINIARGAGLALADKAGPAKRMALKYAMGLD